MRKLVAKMLELVVRSHSGQFDMQGEPYPFHCIQVMRNLNSDDEELCCIALGHDLYEDTKVTHEEVFVEFGPRIANGIMAMTKVPGESYEGYLKRLMENDDAILVKMADLQHNSDITRLRGVTDKDLERLRKYGRAYSELKDEKNLRGL